MSGHDSNLAFPDGESASLDTNQIFAEVWQHRLHVLWLIGRCTL